MEDFESSSDPLPFIQLDRAAKAATARLAELLKVTRQHAVGSLIDFWERCADPRELEALVKADKFEVLLDHDDVIRRFRFASGGCVIDPKELVELQLLDMRGDKYRVRGMSRYFKPIKHRLQARAAGRVGGLASAEARKSRFGSAQPDNGRSTVASNTAQADLEASSKRSRSALEADLEALSNRGRTEPRSAVEPIGQRSEVIPTTTTLRVADAPPPEKLGGTARKSKLPPTPPTDPRHAPLVADLVAIFEAVGFGKYAFGGHDARLVTELLEKGDSAEVLTRWRRALRHEFPTIRTLFDLNKNWNKLSVDQRASTQKPEFDPNQGIIRGSVNGPAATPPKFLPTEAVAF